MCGLGVPVGCRSYWCGLMAARWVGLEGFKGLERLERFRAGKRQTWAPIRSHWCVALGCLLAARVAIRSHWCVALGCLLTARVTTRSHWCVARGGCLEGFKRLERLERFRAGKRQTWAPIRSHWCVALGCLLAARMAIRSHWCVARGGCWLQGEVWRVLGLANGRSYWCGLMAARWVWRWKAKKEKFHTCGGPRRRPCLG